MKKTLLALIFILLVLSQPIYAFANTYTITYTYDDLGRLTSVTYDNGQVISYAYDPGGNMLSATHSDNNPFKIVSTDPSDGAADVPVDQYVYVVFNKNIQPGSDIAGIAIRSADTVVSYTYSIDQTKLLLMPNGNLATSVAYSVCIPKGAVTDASGNTLASDYSFSFTTQATPSFPVIISTDPADGATDVSVTQAVYVAFNEEIRPGDNFSGIVLKTADTVVDTVYGLNANTLTLTPTAPLNNSIAYSVYLPARAVQGLSGNSLANPYSFGFTTQAAQATPVLSALTLTGNPSLAYSGNPVTFDLGTLTLTGTDRSGNPFDIAGQTVTWSVYSGNATVSGSTLTINSAGQIIVTASIGAITSNTLTLTVTQAPPASDATLSSLTVSTGTLAPDFASNTTSYTDTVGNTVTGITVTSTATESHATVTVNNQAVVSGQSSQVINLGVGSNIINIVVTAQDGVTDKTYIVTVTRQAPIITLDPATLPPANGEKPYSQTFTASGGTVPYTYSESGTLPMGIGFNNGTLSGDPEWQGGDFPITITATDANNFIATQSYTLTVIPPTITLKPTVLPAASVGNSYIQTFTASGGISPYTFIESGALPSGMSFSTGLGTGFLSGTPTVTGSFPITVTARDANYQIFTGYGFTGTQSYTLTVNVPTIALSPASLPAAIRKKSYSQTITASGGAAPYTYSESGALPSGISFSNGKFSGTPTVTGSFLVTVTAKDKYNSTGTQSYTLTVN